MERKALLEFFFDKSYSIEELFNKTMKAVFDIDYGVFEKEYGWKALVRLFETF